MCFALWLEDTDAGFELCNYFWRGKCNERGGIVDMTLSRRFDPDRVKMRRTILTGLILFLAGTTEAQPPAGMVLYLQSNSEIYLLLAEHAANNRGWAGFGGGAREGEATEEPAAHTAAEESRGYFDRADLLRRIKGQPPVMAGSFATYFAEVPFVPAQRVINHAPPDSSDAYLERSTFAWIPYSAITKYVKKEIDQSRKYPVDPSFLPAGSETNWFWPIWLGNMRKAHIAKALPWEKD